MWIALSLTLYRFEVARRAPHYAFVMTSREELAKAAWLANLNRPFGSILHERAHDAEIGGSATGDMMKNTSDIDSLDHADAHVSIEETTKRELLDPLEEELILDAAIKIWLEQVEKPIVHSKEKLAKNSRLDNIKRKLQSKADESFGK